MLIATPEIDTSLAQAEWDEFVQDAGQGLDKIVGKGNKVENSLKDMGAEAKKTASALQQFNIRDMLDKGIGKFGDLKDIIEKTGVSVFGLSEENVKAASSTLDMSTKFASFGSLLGPIGAGVGAVVGGLVGYVSATNDATEATEKLAKAEVERDKQLKLSAIVLDKANTAREKFVDLQIAAQNALSGDEFGLIGKSAENLTDIYLDNRDAIESLRISMYESEQDLKRLEEAQGDNAEAVAKHEAQLLSDAETLSSYIAIQNATQSALDATTKSTKKQTSALKALKAQTPSNEEASAEFERQLRSSAEQARLQEIDDLLAFNKAKEEAEVKAQEAEDLRKVQALNKEEEYQANLQRLKDEYQIKSMTTQLEANEKLKDEQAKALEASIAFNNAMVQGALDAAGAVAKALAGQAVEAFDAYLDAVANGEKRTKESNKRQRVEFLRKTGTMLITDGTGHIIAGTVKGIAGDPLGFAEAIAGAGEVAVGAGMGGIGAIGQRSLGGTQSKADSQASPSSGSSVGGSGGGTKTLNPIVINFQSVTPASEREQQDIGNKIKTLIGAADRSGR